MVYINAIIIVIPITMTVLGLVMILTEYPRTYKGKEVTNPKGLSLWVGGTLVIFAALWSIFVLIMVWQEVSWIVTLWTASISILVLWTFIVMLGCRRYNK